MKMNTHFFPNGFATDQATPCGYQMRSGAADEFHNFGMLWKDHRTIIFFYNGKKIHTVRTAGNFDVNQSMFFDTEVFTWAGLPRIANLNDNNKTTMYVDWVCSHRLVKN